MSIHAGNCIVTHHMFQRKCQAKSWLLYMCTADWQALRQTHDGECHHMLFFSVLYQSMIRAHLLPSVLGKGRKTLSLKFCCWSIHTQGALLDMFVLNFLWSRKILKIIWNSLASATRTALSVCLCCDSLMFSGCGSQTRHGWEQTSAMCAA